MSSRLRAALPYLGLTAIAVYLFQLAGTITYTSHGGALGPDFWPKVAIGLMFLVSVVEALRALISPHHSEMQGIADLLEQADSEALEDAEPRSVSLLVGGILLTVGYGWLLPTLGFPIATFLFLVAFMYLGRFRAHGAIWVSSLLGTVLLCVLFLRVVHVSLPRGIEPFGLLTDLVHRF